MKELITVAVFTAKDMLKRKSFIISNIIILLLIVLAFNVPNILNAINGDDSPKGEKLLIVDKENFFEGSLEAVKNMGLEYEIEISNEDINFDKIKEKIENEEIDSAIIISKNSEKINMEYIVENLLYVEKMPEELVSALSTIYSNLQISKLRIINGTNSKHSAKL